MAGHDLPDMESVALHGAKLWTYDDVRSSKWTQREPHGSECAVDRIRCLICFDLFARPRRSVNGSLSGIARSSAFFIRSVANSAHGRVFCWNDSVGKTDPAGGLEGDACTTD